MQGKAPVEEVQAQHGDQQGAHAQERSREPLQVRYDFFIILGNVGWNSILLISYNIGTIFSWGYRQG